MAKVEQKNNYITVRDGEKGKTYRVRIRLQGKYFSETFKTEKEAKQCVITKLAESQKGDDIANLKKFKRTTIHDVVDQYLNYLD